MRYIVTLLTLLCVSPVARADGPWSTYRGNPQRTGNTDGRAGPAAPRLLWSVKSQEHFIASPVPDGDRLYVSALGAFNVAYFSCLATDPAATRRTVWTKTTPYLKLPTVSSPALAGGRLVFGDGMHQTDGAALHCLDSARGMPLWQLALPGKLVHLEGSPTVAAGRVYTGGGAAGVVCVDLDRVTLDGKEMGVPEVRKLLDRRWKELLAKYEIDKKKDPDFAVPPTEDQLPRPAPRLLWQQGKDRWHVDAPVTLAGDRLLVASAFLDKEKVGDRALHCLDARTGKPVWRAPLRLNPWGGASVAGKLAVVAGSTIGYDTRALKAARGEIAAFDLATGKRVWHKDVKGGVVSSVALAGGLAVCTATDGKVRAYDLATGVPRWYHDARFPLFAPPAVAGGVVYAGDLKGVVHALELATGAARWTFDLGAEARAPGMVYGGPVVHGGRVFVATCNMEGPNVRQPTVVACIGDRK